MKILLGLIKKISLKNYVFSEINLNDPPEELRKTMQNKFQIFHKIKKGHSDLNVEDKNQVNTQLTEKVLWEFKNK